ncbi:probable ATP-dependent DNA helicase HFM1 [Lineus longissimus]|uniref:probable ATP-dependent DNA helicase HFM1 n=1 Tax=Lineus longissimus TaxID=88925 RepID=UPI00315DB022
MTAYVYEYDLDEGQKTKAQPPPRPTKPNQAQGPNTENLGVPEPPSFGEIGCLSQVFRTAANPTGVTASQFFPPTQREVKRKTLPVQNFRCAPNIQVGDTAEDLSFLTQPSSLPQTQLFDPSGNSSSQSRCSQQDRSYLPKKTKSNLPSHNRPGVQGEKKQKLVVQPARFTRPLFRPSEPPPDDTSPEIEIVPSPPPSPTRYGSSQVGRYNPQEDLFPTQSQPAGTPATFNRDSVYTPQPLALPGVTPGGNHVKINNLRSVDEIPSAFRSIFFFPYFNIVQSKVFDDVFYRDKSLVVCAPTGSGKTVMFELAIIRILIKMQAEGLPNNFKVVYMAPMKALCSERCEDWKNKFEPLGLKCMELTGDTEIDDWFELQNVNIIMTTPEKWDSMTRKWRDNKSLVQQVKLFLVDEIHMLHDDTRGATMEAVVSRMKTVQAAFDRSSSGLLQMRFVAVSATVPNVQDIAEWLGTKDVPAEYYRMDDSYRPVKLRKVVLGYPCSENQTDFKFDLSLNYKLATVIQTYSDQKPTLVFCATRKGVQQAAGTLVKDARFIMNSAHKEKLVKYSGRMRDSKLRDLVLFGVGYHHAGLDIADRKLMEEIFLNGELPVLLSTSTLAMGVNLPAHLVIVKSTQHYVMGMYQEYSETQILQMIGRAGRPQFDTSATAVIMTRNMTKERYGDLLNGTQLIESSLHKHLIEHVNAEVVLHTITDVSVAVEWLRSTFLHIRVMKNPKHYGIDVGLTSDEVEKQLQDFCMKSLKSLSEAGMIALDEEDQFDVKPTENGRQMARYCVPYETMKDFVQITGTETLKEMMTLVSSCKSYDVTLRTNEKRTLNTMNKDKNRITIRFPMEGKIKTSQMKVNCLLQAQLGCLSVQDFGLAQDTIKIFRVGTRLSRCLVEILWNRNDLKVLLNALFLSKSFKSRIWENSKYVSRQLDGIGPQISNALVNAGVITFQKLEETNPREIEMIVNRHPPFGNNVRDSVAGLPKYEVMVEQSSNYSSQSAYVTVSVRIANTDMMKKNTAGPTHSCALVIGDSDNRIIHKVRLSDSFLNKIGTWSKRINIQRASKGDELSINYISQEWVGLDVQSTYTPCYIGLGGNKYESSWSDHNTKHEPATPKAPAKKTTQESQRPCNHRCFNKAFCGHDCCKLGIMGQQKDRTANATPAATTSKPALLKTPKSNPVNSCLSEMKNRMGSVPATPNLRLKPGAGSVPSSVKLGDFAYTPQPKMALRNSTPAIGVPQETPGLSSGGWEELDIYHQKRTFERDYSPEYQNDSPEYQTGDPITDAMARTGFGNYESSYFDDIGDETEMMQVADAADGPDWEGDFLPDPGLSISCGQGLQGPSSQQVQCKPQGIVLHPQRPKNQTDSLSRRQSAAQPQWSSFSQLETSKNSSSYPPKSDWNTNRGNKCSPITISDDDFEEDQLPTFQKPRPRLGQVFAWSKSKNYIKQQFPHPKQNDSGNSKEAPVLAHRSCQESSGAKEQLPYPKHSLSGNHSNEPMGPSLQRRDHPDTYLKRPAAKPSMSFISAKRMYDQAAMGAPGGVENTKFSCFSGSSDDDDDDLLANHLSSHEGNVTMPSPPQQPYAFKESTGDAEDLDDAENTFSGIFADIF